MEGALRRSREELEIRVEELTAQLGKANEKLQAEIIERKRVEDELATRMRQRAVLSQLSQRALAGGDLDALMDEAVRLVARTFEVEYCKVLELLPDGNALLLRAGVGWKEGLVGHGTVSAGIESQAGYTLLSDGPVIVEDLRKETRFSGPPLLYEHGAVSGISVIIQSRGRPFGVLGAHTIQKRKFTQDDVHFLQAVANILSSAIERKRAQEALRAASLYARSLIEASLDPFVTISADGKVMDVNKATELVTGVSREHLIGSDFSDYFTEPDKAREGYKEVFSKGWVTDYPLAIRHTSGRVTEVLYNATVYKNEVGEVQGVFAAARDVTELRRAEEKLKTYMAKLEWSNRELQDFAFVASHDLQEPLRKIQVFGDQLKTKYTEPLGDEGRDYLERMHSAANRMQALIQALLNYSRVTTKAEPFSPVDLSSLIREVVTDLETGIEEARGRVEVENLTNLEADPNQMRQLFQNLIANALKFRREEKPVVKVYGEQSPAGDTRFQIFVEDNGIGFDEKYLDRIFTPFQRLHGRGIYEGTGIGLAICRKIVERHGGSITAKSTPGKGSTFIVTLPMKQPKEGDA
jgi:PAS domain S-box-containing protein